MGEVRGSDNDRLDVIALDDVLVVRRSRGDTGLLAGAFQGRGIAVAKGDYLGLRTEGEAWQMFLKVDSAAADNRNADFFHGSMYLLKGGEYGGLQ